MQIRVRHDDVAALVAEMAVVGRRIAIVLENLDRESKLLQSDWTGEARDAYRVAHSIDASTSAVNVWE